MVPYDKFAANKILLAGKFNRPHARTTNRVNFKCF